MLYMRLKRFVFVDRNFPAMETFLPQLRFSNMFALMNEVCFYDGIALQSYGLNC